MNKAWYIKNTDTAWQHIIHMNTYNIAILHCKMWKHYQMVPGSLVTAKIVTICRPNESYRQKTSQFCDGIDIKATIYKQKYEADGICWQTLIEAVFFLLQAEEKRATFYL